ncbi:hypothetical protein [Rhodopirellula bahusiensis]|uniref:hypothetical protein n=1 Tax=Rhodopirellula bahusiensis TaxID=2014065 RepID=UPI003264FB58
MSGELSVDYLGLELSSPVVIGACPLTKEPETVRQLIQSDVVMVTSVVYRHGPDAIRDMVDGIRRHVEWSHHPTLREFLAARPVEPVNEERFMRMEYVDPLTRSETYFDSTPEVSPQSGDAYGHQF